MNGDQNPQASQPGRQPASADNPPSLTEPSLPPPVAPARSQLRRAEPAILPPPVPTAADAQPAPDPSTPVTTSQVAPDGAAGGFYHPEKDDAPALHAAAGAGSEPPATTQQPAPQVSWISSGDELQVHAASWRIKMMLASVVIGVLVYLITRDVVSSGAVAVAGILFGILGARKPQPLAYRLDSRGIVIGHKHFAYDNFRAFSVANEVPPSIDLVPLKRFSPMMSLRFDQAQADEIVNVLAAHLPMEPHRRDIFDQITSKIRI